MLLKSIRPQFYFSTATRLPVQIRINVREPISEPQLLEEKIQKIEETPECYFPSAFVQPENPTWIARKHNIRYSAYKLMAVANLITGKHLYEAISILGEVDKKGGPIVKSVLEACRKNGENKGFTEERMFVKLAIVGKALHHKKIDIKGRGRQGTIKVPNSSITITLQEKSPQDYYKLILQGKTPPGISYMVRKMLYQNDADFTQVQAMSHMTTSSGRHYRRVQFLRLIQLVKKQYAAQGYEMKDSKIERNLLEKASRDFVQLQKSVQQRQLIATKASRTALFEKNYKKN